MPNKICFSCGKDTLLWESDYDSKDVDEDKDEGIISCYHCRNCGAEYTVYMPLDYQEKDEIEGDLISRAAVLDEMDKRHKEGDMITKGFIKALPSVQTCEDAVSRAEVLACEQNIWDDCGVVSVKDIKALPPVQPEREKGKWKRRVVDSGFNADWVCNKCGHRVMTDYVNYNFCPNCGADMRGK